MVLLHEIKVYYTSDKTYNRRVISKFKKIKKEVHMRYFVAGTDVGYVIHDEIRTLPLPFLFCSRSNAQRVCERFNQYGHMEVAEYYYTHKVAGTRDTAQFEKSGKNPYQEWMKEHGDMFK